MDKGGGLSMRQGESLVGWEDSSVRCRQGHLQGPRLQRITTYRRIPGAGRPTLMEVERVVPTGASRVVIEEHRLDLQHKHICTQSQNTQQTTRVANGQVGGSAKSNWGNADAAVMVWWLAPLLQTGIGASSGSSHESLLA